MQVPVIAVEHLVVTKILAARPQDLEDVRGVLASSVFDPSEVEALVAALEAELGEGDLLPRWRAVTVPSRRRTTQELSKLRRF